MLDTPAIDTAARTVTVAEAKTRLEDLLGRACRGEEWVIVDADGHPVAKLSVLPGKIANNPEMGQVSQELGPVQWPDFMARLRARWPDGISGQLVSEIVDEGRGPRP